MASLQDLINLAKADGGKFFVIDESGEIKLVLMRVEEYQRLLLGNLQDRIKKQAEDIEKINKEIIKAQLHEVEPPKPKAPPQPPLNHRQADLRAEVIDPSFDFEGPKTNLEDL
jgi:hypothetical protein